MNREHGSFVYVNIEHFCYWLPTPLSEISLPHTPPPPKKNQLLNRGGADNKWNGPIVSRRRLFSASRASYRSSVKSPILKAKQNTKSYFTNLTKTLSTDDCRLHECSCLKLLVESVVVVVRLVTFGLAREA